jgi:hypothetical protein
MMSKPFSRTLRIALALLVGMTIAPATGTAGGADEETDAAPTLVLNWRWPQLNRRARQRSEAADLMVR